MYRSARVFGRVRLQNFILFIALSTAVTVPLAVAPANAEPEKYAGIVVDATTGETLYASNADALRYPASLTKIMTLYLVFEELQAGRLSLDTPMRVSSYASARPPSKLGFKPGQTIRAEDAIKALVTKSANDVAVVVAENIGGTETAFAERMTRTARRLGMAHTTFRNASGLPHSKQMTTARDLARLGIAIQERFPRLYSYFQLRTFTYRGKSYRNHNRLLGQVRGVDGIKTGFIRDSGFNLVASVRRDDRHIVAVVMGGRTGASRNAHMTELIDTYIQKASVGGVRQLYAMSSVNQYRIAPTPRAKPYAMVLASIIERSMLDGPEWRATSASVVDEFAAVRDAREPVRSRLAGNGAQPAPSRAAVIEVASVAPKHARMTAASAPRPTVSNREPAGQEQAAPLAYAQDAFDRVFSQMPQLEAGSVDDLTGLQGNDDLGESLDLDENLPPPHGWHIQLGAVESPDEAMRVLADARGTFPKVLGDRDPYMMTVESAGVTLYRARFVGFASQTDALAACRQLQKARQPCWAEAM